MHLSETSEAQEWLKQFEKADEQAARMLLDDLTIVTPTTFSIGMRELVARGVENAGKHFALYPVWEVVPPASPMIRPSERGESIFPRDPSVGAKATSAAQNSEPTKATIPAPQKPLAGSVGQVITLITGLQRDNPRALDRPALHLLREKRCRTILLLDDILGSGKRVLDYLEAFYEHPTIKSWCSYGKLEFIVICYAASEDALRRLEVPTPGRARRRFHPVRVVYDQKLYRGRSYWSVGERQEIERICRKYGARTSRPKMALGFRDAFSMIAFAHGIPNTAPAILWAGKEGRWKALFPERVIPTGLLGQFEQVTRDPAGDQLAATLSRVNQMRLAGLDWSRYATPAYRQMLLLLGLVARGFRDSHRIGEIMEIRQERLTQLGDEAYRLGFIDLSGKLTDRGARELEYARRMRVSPFAAGPLSDQFYLPQSLKGRVRRSSL